MANPIVRAAVVQAASVIFDTPRTLAKLVNLTEIAAASGAQIIVRFFQSKGAGVICAICRVALSVQ